METLIAVALAAVAQLAAVEPWTAMVVPQERIELLYQADPPAEIEFFSGEVVEITGERVEVMRSALGKNETRRFAITSDTRFEGTPKKGSRVTVGYREKSPDNATRIIVRDGEE